MRHTHRSRTLPPRLPAVLLAMSTLAGCSSTGIEPGSETNEPPPPASATLSGSASWPAHFAMPAGARFEVILEDISRADAPATALGRATLDAPAQPPIEFQLSYTPTEVDPRHTYALRARISLGDDLLLVTDTVHPVLTQGADSSQLVLRPVEMSQDTGLTLDSAVALEDTHWHLIQLQGRDISDGDQQNPAHLVLQAEEHRAVGSGGCNRFFGSYSLQGDSLTFGQLASTMMACMKGMEVEQQLHDALTQSSTWRITQGHLELLNEAGAVLASFEPRSAE